MEYDLTAESIDRIALEVEVFLRTLNAERANVLRIRLSVEEALLRWQDCFGEEAKLLLTIGSRWRTPIIVLELPGEAYDPTANSMDELGAWSENLLSEIGLAPKYAYQRGINILQFRLRRPRKNPALKLLIAVALGVFLGLAGRLLLPDGIQDLLIRTTLDPIQNVFFRALNTVAGPVIFFTVLASICGLGSLAAGGKAGRKMLLRFLLVTSLLTVVVIFLAIPLLSLPFRSGGISDAGVASVLDFFLRFIPNDILSPVINGDGAQIILLAVVLANALLVAGAQAEGVRTLVDQWNHIGLIVTDWVGRLSPFFIVILLILGLWSHSLQMVVGCWLPLLMFLVLMAAILLGWLLWISFTRRVPVSLLVKKLLPSFMVALRTASVDAAFGDNLNCCVKRLGISKELATYGLPMGLVIFMPANTLATMLFTMYTAKCYGIVISPVWCITGAVLAVLLLAASPPMAGVNLLAYAAIFSRLDIPADGLMIALLADVLFGFFTAAANQAMLQLELVIQADRMGYLDRDILAKR